MRRARRLASVALGGVVAFTALSAESAIAQDALICRKRDDMGDRTGKTHRLGPGNDYFNAGPGPDRIYGGPGNDIINGGRGNDIVRGGPGRDVVCGGTGRDRGDGGTGNDEIYGEEGDDRVKGGPGKDQIHGQAGKDKLIGFGNGPRGPVADGRDYLEGSYRPDVLLIGGADVAFGGIDDDLLQSMTPDIGARRLDGGKHVDKIIATNRDDVIFGGPNVSTIKGRGGDDEITGGNHIDIIFGGTGDDRIRGIRGKDRLYGAEGDDFCSGNYRAFFGMTCERTRVIDSHKDKDERPTE